MKIMIAEAIENLRNEFEKTITSGKTKTIVFTPTTVEVELSVVFSVEAKAGGGIKILSYVDLSSECKGHKDSTHKVKITMAVSDNNDQPLKLNSNIPAGMKRE